LLERRETLIGKQKEKFQIALKQIFSLFLEQLQNHQNQTVIATEWKLETVIDSDGEFLNYEYLFIFDRNTELKEVRFIRTEDVIPELNRVSKEDYYILLTGKLKDDIQTIFSTQETEFDSVGELNLLCNKQLLEFLENSGYYLYDSYFETGNLSDNTRLIISSNFLSEEQMKDCLVTYSVTEKMCYSRDTVWETNQKRKESSLNHYKLWLKFNPHLKQIQGELFLKMLQDEIHFEYQFEVSYAWWTSWRVQDKYKFLKEYVENLTTKEVSVFFFNSFITDNNFLYAVLQDYDQLLETPENFSETERELIFQVLVEIFLTLLKLNKADYEYQFGELTYHTFKEDNWVGLFEKNFYVDKTLLCFLKERLNSQPLKISLSPSKVFAFKNYLGDREENVSLVKLLSKITQELKFPKEFVTLELDSIFENFDYNTLKVSHNYQLDEILEFIFQNGGLDSLTVTVTEKELHLFRKRLNREDLTDSDILEMFR
jgi:hypothetical protein